MAGLTSPAQIRALFAKYYSEFEGIRAQQATPLDRLFDRVDSRGPYNTYGWFGAYPKFRQWVGPRHFKGLSTRVYQIFNKPYELSIKIDVDTFDDAQFVDQQRIVRGMAEEGNNLPTDLVLDLMRNGQSRVGYDGQPFFSTNHPVNPDYNAGTQSNYYASGFPLTRANFAAARGRLRGFRYESGRFLGMGQQLLLVVPSALEETAASIVGVNNVAVAGGVQTNTLYNAAQVLVVPELDVDPVTNADTSATWYLFSLGGATAPAPFIYQERQAPRFWSKTDLEADNYILHREYWFLAEANVGAGYGAWFRAIKASA
jgi:phage major head subunit gpT-like protein